MQPFKAENLVINNCGQTNLGILKGGNYTFLHATFANYWNLNSTLPSFGIYATNEYNNGTSPNRTRRFNIESSKFYCLHQKK